MKEKIIGVIARVLKIEEASLTPQTRIQDVEGWDSLAQVMIISELEEELELHIPIDKALEIERVADFIDLAEQ